jgi:hypothetical protein
MKYKGNCFTGCIHGDVTVENIDIVKHLSFLIAQSKNLWLAEPMLQETASVSKGYVQ